jgi:MFS family permease
VIGRVKEATGRTFLSLRNRNFRLFFYGQLVSNTGNWLTNVALTLLVLHLTNSGLAIGALTAAQFGPILFLSPFAGALADRSDKRRMLFVTQSLEMGQSVVLAVFAFMPHPPLAGLYLTAVAGGVFLAFDNPLRRSFVTEMVSPDDRPNAVALYSAIVNSSRILGPALAGVLVSTVGYGWCFTVDAASYVFVLVALAMMHPAELFRVAVAGRAKGAVRAGLRYLAGMPNLRIAFVTLAVVGTLGYNLNVELPLLVEHTLHHGNAAFAFLYVVFSCGALLSALIVAQHALVRVQHILLGASAFGVALLALSAVPTLAVAVPVVFAVGVTSILYFTATTAIVQVEADPAMHGRILALQSVLLVGTAPIGGPIDGAIADAFGARVPLVIGGIASIAAAAWGYLALRRSRRAADAPVAA